MILTVVFHWNPHWCTDFSNHPTLTYSGSTWLIYSLKPVIFWVQYWCTRSATLSGSLRLEKSPNTHLRFDGTSGQLTSEGFFYGFSRFPISSTLNCTVFSKPLSMKSTFSTGYFIKFFWKESTIKIISLVLCSFQLKIKFKMKVHVKLPTFLLNFPIILLLNFHHIRIHPDYKVGLNLELWENYLIQHQ